MFDDILYTYTISLTDYINDPRCFKCKSRNLKEYGNDIFVDGYTFRQPVICDFCGYQWCVLLNNSLNIIDILVGELK